MRQALSLAIDRQALAARALDGQAVPTVQMVPEQFGGFDASIPLPAADPARARALLAEAGYPDGFGITIGCSNNRYVNDARVCQALGQMLTRAGFQVRVETMPWNVFSPRTLAQRNDLPLMLYGLSLSSSRDASYILSTAVRTRVPELAFGQGNRGGFSDARLDAMIDAVIGRADATGARRRCATSRARPARSSRSSRSTIRWWWSPRGAASPTRRAWTNRWWRRTRGPRRAERRLLHRGERRSAAGSRC